MLGETIGSDVILVMNLTHTQKIAHEWRIAHILIYYPKIMLLNDVELLIRDIISYAVSYIRSPVRKNHKNESL